MKKLLLLLGAALLLPLAVLPLATQAQGAKDRIVIGMALEPPHLDPTAGAAAAIDEVVYANVFEGLTRIDQNGGVQPALAASWTISEDGLVYDFTLRSAVKFHDGTDFEATDVVFALERVLAEDSTNAQKRLYTAIDRVEAIGASQVRLTLSRPEGSLLFNLGWGDAVIVAPESAEANKSAPVGTGPYRFSRWVQGDRVELVANDDRAPLSQVTFKFIADASAQMAALLAGDIDAFPNFGAPESLKQFEADARFEVVIGNTEGETILSTNNTRTPFDDVRVRRAIAYAINRQEFIDGAYFGYGKAIGSHFAPHHPAYVDLTGLYAHDVDRAKALLAEAGFPNGFKATLKLPPPTYARRGGEVVAAQLARVGIEVEIIPVEWAQWLEQVFRGDDFDLTIVSHTEPLDIGTYVRDGYYFNYESAALKSVIDELDRTADQQARYALLGDAQRIVAEDAVNGFIFQLPKLGVWKKGLVGLWENSPVQANDMTQVRWQ